MIAPLPITESADRLLSQIEHDAGAVADLGASIVAETEAGDQLDARSDAQLREAYRLAGELERLSPVAAPLARLIRERITQGLALDDLEDEHRRSIGHDGAEVQVRGRRVVRVVRACVVGGPGPEGDAA